MQRRRFLSTAGFAIAAGAILPACADSNSESKTPRTRQGLGASDDEWQDVRRQFNLSPDLIHMSAMLLSAHPSAVREAIQRYREELNANPVLYAERQNDPRKDDVRSAAARYLGGSGADEIALTDSTTMGIAIVYHGLRLGPGDEILTTEHDYYATHETLRQVAGRTGATVRKVRLFDDPSSATVDQMVSRIAAAVTPATRLLALTWVHSSTGLKLPVAEISEAVRESSSGRGEEQRPLIGLDGVHGFGVEDIDVTTLGCDFFITGCHKWLFGPRGTGIVRGREDAWARLQPSIPSFIVDLSWVTWAVGRDPAGPTTAARMSPGGFKSFEHQWAMADALPFTRTSASHGLPLARTS